MINVEKREILRRLVRFYSDITMMDEEDVDSSVSMDDITNSPETTDDFDDAVWDEFGIDISDELVDDTFETLSDVVNHIYRCMH
jgi:acyl carrier protein